MLQPARWQDDPPCGHLVACAFQTHYCTYVRAPRLLALQGAAGAPGEMLVLLAARAAELWLKVVATDLAVALDRLRAGEAESPATLKFLHRCAEILALLERQVELQETITDGSRASFGPLASPGLETLRERVGQLEQAGPRAGARAAGLARTVAARAERLAVRFEAWYRGAAAGNGGRSYAESLSLAALLGLQDGPKAAWTPAGEQPTALAAPESISPDELMFIVVHQAFELWFKAILQELDRAVARLLADPPQVAGAARCLRRVVEIQRLLVRQIQIPATMLPLDFLRFRDERQRGPDGREYYRGLSPASGTESYQFREIEILAGLRDEASFRAFLEGAPGLHIRFLTPDGARRLSQPSLPEAFERALARRGITGLTRLFTPADRPNPHADLAGLADLLLEFDQFFKLWRVGHLTMVERMIGDKSGTGFLGPEYLRETTGMERQGTGRIFAADQTRPRFFPRLFATRSRLGY